MDQSFFVGDAAGRYSEKGSSSGGGGDHSASDVKFAVNIGVPYKTPEVSGSSSSSSGGGGGRHTANSPPLAL